MIPTDEYRPLGAWRYIGYQLLFTFPVIGQILLIVFALDNSYIARRNFARSFLLIIAFGILITILLVLAIRTAFISIIY
jgi:hypothetical protein